MSTDRDYKEPIETVYKVREAVALFVNEDALENAADKLMQAAVSRVDISILATDKAVEGTLSRHYRRASGLEDNPSVKQRAFVSSDSIVEGQAALFGIPIYIGTMAGTAAVVASGGALGFILMAAAAGGMAGGAIGAMAANALGDHHAKVVEDQLKHGGLLLWVRLREGVSEKEIQGILEKAGGKDVHVHELERIWGEKDIPLHDFNPDPLLESDE